MKALAPHEINGVWATPLLRVGPNGQPILDGLADQIDHFADAGVDGVYTHGTAAEFHGQSDAFFRAFCDVVAQRCTALHLPFQIGASHPFAHETLKRIKFARSWHPAAIQVVLPDWAPVDLRVARRFIEGCVAEATGVGIVLYNPPHAKRAFQAKDLVALLKDVPGIVGLKCAGGDADWFTQMQPLLADISVFIPGHFMASGMAKGARGSYSNVCCLNPHATVVWRDQVANDPRGAMELEHRINAFMTQYIQPFITAGYPGYACDKFMAYVGGWFPDPPDLVWPYLGIPKDEAPRVRQALKDIIPEFS